jgi:hypothetical protein
VKGLIWLISVSFELKTIDRRYFMIEWYRVPIRVCSFNAINQDQEGSVVANGTTGHVGSSPEQAIAPYL